MNRKLEFARTITRMIYQCIFTILMMHMVFLNYAEHPYNVVYVIVVIVLYGISYGIRCITRKAPILALVHIAFGALIWLPGFEITAIVTIDLITVILMVQSIMIDLKEGVPRVNGGPIGMGLAAFGAMFYANYKGYDSLSKEAFFIPAAMILLYLVMIYLDGLKGYMMSTSKITGIPMGRLIMSNSVFVASLLIMLLLAIILIGLFFHNDNALLLARIIGSVFTIIIIGFVYITGSFVRFFTKEPVGQKDEDFQEKIKKTVPASSGDFIETLLKIAIIIVIMYILYRIVRQIAKYILTRKQETMDVVGLASADYDVSDEVEDYKKEKKSIFLSPEEKIRKLYKDRVLKHKAYLDLSPYKTARNYEDVIREEGLENLKDATDIYTSVRYGDEEVDKKTVKKMKEILKNR